MIIDTHVHVVSGDRQAYPVLPTAPDWPVTEIDPLIADMDRLGVDKAVLVQTFFTYGPDNRYMIDCARRHPGRLQTVCVIDQTRPNAPDTLSDLVETQGVRGLRLMPKGFHEGVLSDPKTFPLWERAIALGIPITLAAEIQHIPEMHAVVERFPEATVCFEHMWGLDLGPPPYAVIAPVLELARYPNVRMKLVPNNSFAVREAGGDPAQFFGLLDLRGSGRSGGRYRYFDLKDGDDSADVIDWIAGQPWSNGKVGGVGHSIYAIEQWYMAASRPAHLSCIAPFDGGTDIHQMAHPGGVSEGFEANIYNNQFRVLNLYPLVGPPRVLEEDYPLLTLEHTALDGYWKPKVVQPQLGRVTIPVLSIGVWQNVNNHLQGNIDGFEAVSGPKKLLVFGINAQARFETRSFQDRYILPFYDWCLKGERTAYLDAPPVRFFMPGAGRFYQAKSWPPEGVHDETLYLSPERSGSVVSLNDGRLTSTAPTADRATAYAYPNPNWTSGVVGEGPDGKPDPVRYILTYNSAPLAQDLAVTGSPMFMLYAASARPDTWFFVRLSDQSPQSDDDRAEGLQPAAHMVTRGTLAATHRDSDEAPTPITPGKVYRFVIPLKPTANLFRRGDRVRVEIANGDSQLTDGPFAAIVRPNQVGVDTVHNGSAYPSALVLPVAPASLQAAEP